MFSDLDSATRGRQGVRLAASVGAHLILLAWLLHVAAPQIIVPTSIQRGAYGKQVTSIYWPAPDTATSGTNSEEAGPEKAVSSRKLALPVRAKKTEQPSQDLRQSQLQAEAGTASPSAPSAGSPYGSLYHGPLDGHDVRPALPLRTMDPVVDPSGVEGSVVVEITIDEKGKIVQKVVIQSLAPAVDAMVLAALNDWEFRPATRDGVPIASKQDVYYHFPIRR
ncbi:MAG: TonB family protein [Acidobacteriales bacterium]|nr:TonB family protein [Terriglobales bacterium]